MSLSLAENVIIAEADNYPLMLDKTNYSSWASRMLLFIKGKEHGKLLVDSVLNGPFQYKTIIEPGNETIPATVRAQTYTDPTYEEKIRESVDIKATNIVLKGLAQDIYNLVNHNEHAKQIWDIVKLLIQEYQPKVVTHSPVVHQQPCQAHALQQSYQASAIQQPSSTELDSGLVVPSFNPSDDLIANLNKLMAFVTITFAPRFLQTNNQLRTSSNPRNQETIQDGRVLTAYLDPKQLAFLAENGDTFIPAQASQEILSLTAFQTDDLDAFDSDCDDAPSAKAVLMANLSSYDIDVLSEKHYKFKEGVFPNLHLNDIEDMLLLIAQNKLFNLDGDVIVDFLTALKMFSRGIIVKNRVEDVQLGVESYQRKLNLTKPQRTCQHISVKEPYTPNFDPPRVIYEDKSKKKRLIRVDEIHKFCDGTLQSVCNILRERLLNFKFGYNKGIPSREWTIKDKRPTCIMLNRIDDPMFKRRVLRSLEVLVGGRKTETDKQLL
ncbi:hypothetical protein Tco_0353233 [Tanacetum coccineum]